MAMNTEKNSYTVIFAIVMVVVVGSILAYLASGLRPRIDENERFKIKVGGERIETAKIHAEI